MKKDLVCLSIDTTGSRLGLALSRGQAGSEPRVLASVFTERPLKQSDLLIPAIARLMKKNRVSPRALGLLAVNAGPGSFTGVRVGVATARALAQAWGKPLVSVNALETLAFQVQTRTAIAAPFLPALPGEAYFAAYRPGDKKGPPRPLIKPFWGSVEAIAEQVRKLGDKTPVVLTSDDPARGTVRMAAPPNASWLDRANPARPSTVAALALARYFSGRPQSFDFSRTHPFYLQPSWAERERDKKKNG